MDSNSGFGANGAPFEYAVSEAKGKVLTLKKIGLITLYVVWCVVVFLAGAITKLFVPLLALVPLSLWVIVFFTWRFVQVEYEYSFFSGKLTVTRVLGGRTRKQLAEVSIRDLTAVFPYENANVSRAEAWGAERSIFAASGMQAADLYIALWQDEISGKRILLCFEANEKALRILRYYNAAAMAK